MALINVPNLPTDNLYKFKSLSGLIVCLSMLVGIIYIKFTLQTSIYRDALESIRLDDELSDTAFIGQLTKINSTLRDLLDDAKIDTSASQLKYYKTIMNNELNRYDSIKEYRKEIIKKNIQQRDVLFINQKIFDDFNWLSVPMGVLFLASIVFTYRSFDDWYKKHQKYLDMILMRQAGVTNESPDKTPSTSASNPVIDKSKADITNANDSTPPNL